LCSSLVPNAVSKPCRLRSIFLKTCAVDCVAKHCKLIFHLFFTFNTDWTTNHYTFPQALILENSFQSSCPKEERGFDGDCFDLHHKAKWLECSHTWSHFLFKFQKTLVDSSLVTYDLCHCSVPTSQSVNSLD
jgi:hypothetical protein